MIGQGAESRLGPHEVKSSSGVADDVGADIGDGDPIVGIGIATLYIHGTVMPYSPPTRKKSILCSSSTVLFDN